MVSLISVAVRLPPIDVRPNAASLGVGTSGSCFVATNAPVDKAPIRTPRNTHAIRFTVQNSRRAYVHPARHYASSNTSPNLPPMGMRVRLKASFNISGFSPKMQVILRAMKKYGMIVADNGSNWYISGAPDPRWNESDLHSLSTIKGSDFEVVQMGTVVTK